MTRGEQMRFIDEELKGLWPQWRPTEAEIRIWMGALAGPDYATARTALDRCFCEHAGNYSKPKPAPFLAKLRSLGPTSTNARRRAPADVQTCVFIECLEAPPWNVHLAHQRAGVYVCPIERQDDLDYVRVCAEPMRKRVEQLYGGHWITAVEKPRPAKQSNEPFDREQNRHDAYAQILAGPDTPGRRWLEQHLAQGDRRDDTEPATLTSDASRLGEQMDPLPETVCPS